MVFEPKLRSPAAVYVNFPLKSAGTRVLGGVHEPGIGAVISAEA